MIFKLIGTSVCRVSYGHYTRFFETLSNDILSFIHWLFGMRIWLGDAIYSNDLQISKCVFMDICNPSAPNINLAG